MGIDRKLRLLRVLELLSLQPHRLVHIALRPRANPATPTAPVDPARAAVAVVEVVNLPCGATGVYDLDGEFPSYRCQNCGFLWDGWCPRAAEEGDATSDYVDQ